LVGGIVTLHWTVSRSNPRKVMDVDGIREDFGTLTTMSSLVSNDISSCVWFANSNGSW